MNVSIRDYVDTFIRPAAHFFFSSTVEKNLATLNSIRQTSRIDATPVMLLTNAIWSGFLWTLACISLPPLAYFIFNQDRCGFNESQPNGFHAIIKK